MMLTANLYKKWIFIYKHHEKNGNDLYLMLAANLYKNMDFYIQASRYFIEIKKYFNKKKLNPIYYNIRLI